MRALSCRVSCCDVMKVSSDRPTYFAYAFREEEKEGSRTAADLLRQTTRLPALDRDSCSASDRSNSRASTSAVGGGRPPARSSCTMLRESSGAAASLAASFGG